MPPTRRPHFEAGADRNADPDIPWPIDPFVFAINRQLKRRNIPLGPVFDKSFEFDLATGIYTGYREHTPGALGIPPDQFMERRFYDVLPRTIAETIDRAIFHAKRTERPTHCHCRVFDQWVSCQVSAHDNAQVDVIVRPA